MLFFFLCERGAKEVEFSRDDLYSFIALPLNVSRLDTSSSGNNSRFRISSFDILDFGQSKRKVARERGPYTFYIIENSLFSTFLLLHSPHLYSEHASIYLFSSDGSFQSRISEWIIFSSVEMLNIKASESVGRRVAPSPVFRMSSGRIPFKLRILMIDEIESETSRIILHTSFLLG